MAFKPEMIFRGSGVSSGVVIGQALKIDRNNRFILKLPIEDADAEVERFLKAIEISKEQVQALKSRLEEKVGEEHGVILDAHFLILDDRTLHVEIIETIRNHHVNTEWALIQATDRLVHAYKSLEDEYFQERHSDIEHVVERILNNLLGDQPFSLGRLPEDVILVCHDFNPSNFATMDLEKVRGLVMETGGRTAHTAIISRGLRLPAVMGIRDILAAISTGDGLLLDGDTGQVVINPAPERMESVRQRQKSQVQAAEVSDMPATDKTVTRDGKPISLCANTELHHELNTAKSCGANGIGLYRSEFLYFSHPLESPSMADQLEVYRALAIGMHPHPVSIRTLDAGSEKLLKRSDAESPINSSMGLRGIRLSMQIKDVFLLQIEAILRAACEGNIEIVLPMVSTIEEVWQAKEWIASVRSWLYKEFGLEPPPVPLGVMIEVPAVVLTLEAMAKEVDFFCVGTNDLIQYLLAVDRGNSQVAYLFQPLHPSVLACLSHISVVSAKMKKPVRICGEISSNPFLAVLLIGMGFNQFSMNPLSIGMIRKVIREVTLKESRKIAKKALTMITAKDVHDYLIKEVSKIIPFDLSAYIKEITPSDMVMKNNSRS
jgi:phosphoenolpyruvate-protein phosphotransferase (PTS system enzyme I)